jgi:hypothetical protein
METHEGSTPAMYKLKRSSSGSISISYFLLTEADSVATLDAGPVVELL